MPASFDRQRIRLPFDGASRDKVKDDFTGSTPDIYKGTDVQFEIGAFLRAPELIDVTAYQQMRLVVRQGSATGGVIMSKVIEAINAALTAEQWNAGTHQHAVVSFTNAETNVAAGTHHLALEALTVDDPARRVTLGATTLKVTEDGIGTDAGEPPAPVEQYLTEAQTEARYARPGLNCAHYRSDLTGRDGESAADLDSVPTLALAAGYWIAFEVTGQGMKNYKLRAGTAVQALPGVVLPADYNAETNAKYWEAV